MIKTHPQSVQRGAGSTSRHGGAVIVVVLALMAMLAFLGLFFFEFASEQYNTSENFASVEDVDIDPELTFNEILQQTVVGTTNQQSVLDGGTWSLLSSILGKPNSNLQFNVSPYTGSGIAVGYDPTGLGSVTFDYNNDGTADTFIVNFSRSQQPGMSPTYPTAMSQFEPNAGYIYPDINSLFLGFDGYTFDRFGSGAKYHHVVIPSYFRPQYFRSFRGDATSMTPANYAGIYTTGTTALQVLHPHRDHKAWTGSAGGASRFLNTATQAVSGDQSRRIQPFPFVVDRHSPTSPTTTRLGIFTDHSLSITGGRQEYDYEYDADADADGQSDAILMDLGLPLINLPRGRQVVPLTFIKWTDGDGLLSLNSAGNLTALRFYGTPFNGAAPTPNNPQFGQSNFGRSRAEMNLAWALYANPRNTAFLATADIEDVTRQQFFATTVQFHGTLTGQADLFRHPFMANVEMAALLAGRYPYRNSGTTPFKPLGDQSPLLGRWGDDYTNTLAFEGYLQGMNGSATLTWPTTPPGAGKPGATDDTDVWYPSYGGQFGQPADPLGRGSLVNPTVTAHGYVRAMANVGAGPVRLPFNVGTWPTSAYPAALHEAVGNFGFDDEASEGFPDKVL
ncbi:hypothetical protein, partial [Schlesneria sp.]|uniref:hypothetical protein n=1 Tax=Schlesneria sp. TaxID=2762018 RepID=UPI002EDF5CA2